MYSEFFPRTPVPISDAPIWLLQASTSVQAGFPSPAEEFGAKRLDLSARLIKHPQATHLLGVSGNSMVEEGINDGDLLIVDKALRPEHDDIVVAVLDSEFTVKKLEKRFGHVRLKAGNPTYPDIIPRDGQTIEVWGVVTASIKIFKR